MASALSKPESSDAGGSNDPPAGRTDARRKMFLPPPIACDPTHAASALPWESNPTSTGEFTPSPAGRGTSAAALNEPPGGRTEKRAAGPCTQVTSVVPWPSTATRGEPMPTPGPASVSIAPNGPPGGRVATLTVWVPPAPPLQATTSVPSEPNTAWAPRAGVTSPGIATAGSHAGAASAGGATSSASPRATDGTSLICLPYVRSRREASAIAKRRPADAGPLFNSDGWGRARPGRARWSSARRPRRS